MKLCLLRHGRTLWNDENRYQGRRDIPLSAEGAAELVPPRFTPQVVYVSSLCRTWQTAERLFPGVRQVIVPDFAEMDFGAFEGRTAAEMEEDAAYRSWVDGGCRGRCPGGEDLASFSRRVCAAFETLLDTVMDDAVAFDPPLTIVAHGGALMAMMERFALPMRDFFAWRPPKGGGYLLEWDASLWRKRRRLHCLETVQCTRHGSG